MAEFKISFQKTLVHESEYVNDPVDSGKETYRGILPANHDNWKGWSVIDQYKIKPNFLFSPANNADLVFISAKVSHHFGKVSHLQKLGGFVCKCRNII